MIEEQLRRRLAATAEELDQSSAPLDDIRMTGSSIKRRRARTRVAGLAATVVAVAGVALAIPTSGPESNGPAPATSPPSPSSDQSEELRPPFPGLKKSLETELRAAGPAQRRALEDNRVTRAEYRAGFDRYRACLAGRGYQLESVDRSGVVIDFSIPGAAVTNGADAPCYRRHFQVVDMAWQGAHDDTDYATTMRIVNDCLEANGLSPGTTPGEAIHLMWGAGLSDEECGLAPGQLE